MNAAACPVCGATVVPPSPCPRCGAPELAEEAARALGEAAQHLAAGRLDASIRQCQQAVKAAPDALLPRLRLAAGYERRAADGTPELLRLADRELARAIEIAPDSREAHMARIALGARTGRGILLRAEYEGKVGALACAAECLKVLDALETAGAEASRVAAATGEASVRSRYLILGGIALGAGGVVEAAVVIYGALTNDEYVIMGHMDFPLAVGLLTAAAACLLEGVRERRAAAAAPRPRFEGWDV